MIISFFCHICSLPRPSGRGFFVESAILREIPPPFGGLLASFSRPAIRNYLILCVLKYKNIFYIYGCIYKQNCIFVSSKTNGIINIKNQRI